jgi:hypothetical protein
MPTAQERDEQDAQDPFDRHPVADHGYRVGTRLARPRDRRPQLVVAALAAMLGGAILLAAIRIRLPDVAVAPSLGPHASGPLAPIPTRPPGLQRFDPAAAGTIAPIPVFSGGLRWLEPTAGVISGPPFSGARGWIFAGSDGGAWCVCYDTPWSPDGTIERETVVRYDPTGRQLSRTMVGALESERRTSDAIQRDAARSADGRFIYVAAVIRDETGWSVRIDQIDVTGKPRIAAGIDVGRVDAAPEGTTMFAPVVRVSPDGALVRVAARYLNRGSFDEPTWPSQSVWLVRPTEVPGAVATVSQTVPRSPLTDPNCQAEGWVSATAYATLCAETIDDRRSPLAHIEYVDGSVSDINVGDPVGTSDLDWLVDAGAGVIYRWSPFSHIVARLDVASEVVTERVDLGLAPARAQPDTDRPAARPGRAAWQPLVSAESVEREHLAGSPDGSLLYAIGATGSIDGEGPSGPLYASTGVFAFDAATLGLVAHWPAAAMYDQVGVSPDGRFVLGVGLEGMTQDGRVADWPASLTFHDAVDGHVVEQLSQLAGDEGYFVDLLAPGPVP